MQEYKISGLESQTIDFLRFPMIIGVLFIHSGLGNVMIDGHVLVNQSDYPLFTSISCLFSQILGSLAVPFFFFISGLFFFMNPVVDFDSWINKIKKRIRTLFVPYVVWNLIYLLLYFLGEKMVPQFFSGRNQLVSELSLGGFLSCFWNYSDGRPIDFPLWFIRDLMVVNLFSYLIFKLIKRFRIYYILLIGFIWMADFEFLPLAVRSGTVSFFFFSLGAYFSINRYSLLEKLKPYLFWSVLLYIPIVIVLLVFCTSGNRWISFIHDCGIIVGMTAAFAVSRYFVKIKGKSSYRFFSKSTFFIFAFHALPLTFMLKLGCKCFTDYTDLSLIAIYVISPTVVLLLGLWLYYLITTYFKPLSAILTGGR